MGNIGTGITDVTVHFAENTNVLIAVEKRVFVLTMNTSAASAAMGGFVGFETGVGQNNDESLRVLVTGGNRHFLLGYELREHRRRERLSS